MGGAAPATRSPTGGRGTLSGILGVYCEAAAGDLWVALGIYYRTHKFNVFAPE